MKKNKFLIISLISAGFLLFGQLIVKAQTRQLSENDKTQIIQAILRQENFKDSGSWDEKEAVNIVYISNENVTPQQLPEVKGIDFVLISPEEIELKKQNGIEYYDFGDFETNKNLVTVYFSRTSRNSTARQSNGSTTRYECRKVSGKWKLKGKLDSVYAS